MVCSLPHTRVTKSGGTNFTQICAAVVASVTTISSVQQQEQQVLVPLHQIPVGAHVQSAVGIFAKAVFPKFPTTDCTSNFTGIFPLHQQRT